MVTPADPIQKIMTKRLAEIHPEESLRSVAQELVADEIGTTDLVAAGPQDSIAAVGWLMLDTGVRHIVVRESDTVVGLVSIRDLLAVLLASVDPRDGM
ncbi:MAG: CBS domain-containing protein [Pseudonocardiaceae bacterium]